MSEGVIHQLHQQNGQSYCRILRQTQVATSRCCGGQKAALPFKQLPVPWVVGVYQYRVEEFGRARQLAQGGLAHLALRSRTERYVVVLQQMDGAETDCEPAHNYDRTMNARALCN